MLPNDRAHLRVWLYRRTAPGEFVPIAIKTWDRWIYGKAAIPPCEDGFVWYVSITVWSLDRRAIEVDSVSFSKARVTAAGFHDDEMRDDEIGVALRALGGHEGAKPCGKVVDASNRFAQRKFRWKPTAADLRSLREIVARRTGRKLIG